MSQWCCGLEVDGLHALGLAMERSIDGIWLLVFHPMSAAVRPVTKGADVNNDVWLSCLASAAGRGGHAQTLEG